MAVQFPEAFKAKMQHQLGDNYAAFESAHAEEPPVSVRRNPLKKWEPTVPVERIPWTQHGLYLSHRPSFTADPLFHAGCYYVQEASSMFVEQAIRQHLPTSQSLRVLDLCAAPGGKSTHALSILPPDALVVSNEVIRSRVNVLSENIQKWGYPNAVVTNNDPKDFAFLTGFFDVIIVDAPCSGEGLFRKDPNAINEWSQNNVAICSQRQRRIVQDIWSCLKANGLLIYSTCTYNDVEDEGTIRWIKDNFACSVLPLDTKDWNIDSSEEARLPTYHFYPHRIRGEGFFLAAIRKEQSEPETKIRSKQTFAVPVKKHVEEVAAWINTPELRFIQRDEIIQALPSQHHDAIHFLAQQLRVVYAGTFIAAAKQNKLVPEHALALSIGISKERLNSIELSEKEAIQYLRKDQLSIQSDKKGFALATYHDVPLGWLNLITGRINNLYPSDWRIRMQI
jgi:16S rRNA C967 or C1407 C5-methylase (RsmB/RsmF family)/NOL1/NOP2/fmu family ribosome biogenesis protein